MLGKDHGRYSDVGYCQVTEKITCAICVGEDANSPSLMFKGSDSVLNEDAVLALQLEKGVLLAVADSHFGYWASHELVSGLAKYGHYITSPASLFMTLQQICADFINPTNNSKSTLLVAYVDNTTGKGFGASYGDSSALIVNERGAIRLNNKNTTYVSPNTVIELGQNMANGFDFSLDSDDILLLFTDGIDECHYGSPQTSVTDDMIHKVFMNRHIDLKARIGNLANLALHGVGGNPGGQDNIAIAGFTR